MKYEVAVYQVYRATITVDAESANHARRKVENQLWQGLLGDDEFKFEYTMDQTDWDVVEVG